MSVSVSTSKLKLLDLCMLILFGLNFYWIQQKKNHCDIPVHPTILLEGLTTTFSLYLDSLDLCSLPSFGNLISPHSWS
jgi:hypothetical protein